MFNQNQNYTQIMNQQFGLQQEPDYGHPINLPRSVQINNPELFTGLYWMGRWTLQNLVQGDEYFTPSWNILSVNNFENQDFAKCVARMCTVAESRNSNNFQNDVVLPILEMDAGIRWCDNPTVAQQVLPQQYQSRALEWKGRADQLMGQTNRTGFQQNGGFQQQQGGFVQQGGFNQQQGGSMFANNSQPAKSWGNSQQVSGTNRSGFFNDNAQQPVSSRNAAGIRTTTSAYEQHSAPAAKQQPVDSKWQPRSVASKGPGPTSSGWGTKSTQQQAAENLNKPQVNPLDEMLPQGVETTEWTVKEEPTSTFIDNNTGSNDMPHEVNVNTPLQSTSDGRPVTDIKCPVLSPVAKAVFGEFLPKVAIITGKNDADNVLVLPYGQTDIEVVKTDDAFDTKLAYDADTILLDYIWADYEKQLIVSKTIPVNKGDTEMDYVSHTLSGPVAAVHPKHVVKPAAMTTLADKVGDEGMVSKHRGKTIDESRGTYTSGETSEFTAASIKVQTQDSVDKSIETYDKLVTPFVMPEGFELSVVTGMGSITSERFDTYVETLGTLPRTMQLWVSGHILKDVCYLLEVQLDAELNITDFDDIVDVEDYIRENRSGKMADQFAEELSRIMRNNIRTVPDAMRDEAIASLGDSIPKTTDNLLLLERSRYILALPYTLSELNISAESDELFYVRDSSHSGLHEAVQTVFSRLTKTEISDFSLRLADGVTYQICKLGAVAKTYAFSKVS